MEEIKIEKGIGIPERKRGLGASDKYPFAGMEIGDSFIFPKEYSGVNMTAAYNNGNIWAKRKGNGWKFCVRKVEGNKIRIWRVK